MSASKVLDLAEKQGLLDRNAVAELRKQVAESKFVVTPEAIAKVLVDHGHLTAFQARKLVATALGEPEPTAAAPQPAATVQGKDLGLADSAALIEDIVDMEVAAPAAAKAPAAKPPPPKPPRSQAETAPLDVAARPAPPRVMPPPMVPPPSPLQPIGPHAAAPSPLTPVTARPAAGPATFQPVDLLAQDPLQAGVLTPAEQTAQQKPAPKRHKNPWESPTFLLVGTLFLGLMVVAFLFLRYALYSVPVEELRKKADEEYLAGSLGSATEKYQEYLKKVDPKSPEASLARVRLGMIQLRQASAEGRNPASGIPKANQILPELQKEEKFGDCRLELRTILVDMAHTSATEAQAAKETARKEKLVAQTDEGLKLVENASYIPSSLRAEVQPRIKEAEDRLKAARRRIDQDKELVKAVAAIKDAAAQSDAAKAYQIRRDLLKTYPALEADPSLLEATQAVGAMERDLVKAADETLASTTEEVQSPAPSIVLTSPSGGAAPVEGQYAATLVHGSVYGVNVKEGKIAWRRYVGYETMTPPQPISSEAGAHFLIVDSLKHEFLRVKGDTGEIVWRLPLKQPFHPPSVGTDRAFATTADGQVLEINLADGQSTRRAKLPQKSTVSPFYDHRRTRLIQLGEHSTLYVLDADRLTCTETFYTGHKAGAILVPPVVSLDHILLVESPADYSLVHVLVTDPEKKQLQRFPDPFRLRGRVTLPMVVDRNRVVVVTDRGQAAVFQVDPANKERPVRQVATGEATQSEGDSTFFAVTPGQVFLANTRLACLEVQGTQQKLASKWQLHANNIFVAPPQVFGKVLLHVRRQPGSLATTIEACNADNGQAYWSTDIAAPVVALGHSEERNEIAAVTSRGRIFELPLNTPDRTCLDKPAYVPLPGSESMSLTDAVLLGAGRFALLGPRTSGDALVYDVNAAANRTRQIKFNIPLEQASSAATLFQGGVVVPQRSGQVLLLDLEAAGQKAQPFQPALQAGQQIPWKQPAPMPPDGTTLAISDGQRTIYKLAIRPQPQPHLESLGEAVVDNDIVSPLAAAGDCIFAVIDGPSGDVAVALQGENLTVAGKHPLQGDLQFGPVAVDGVVFVADDAQLHALEAGGKVRWSQPLAHGQLAMAPLKVENDYLVVTRTGAVCRLSGADGSEVAVAQIGEPAGGAAAIAGTQVVVAGSDGVLHTIPIPAGK